jgi:tetratricopeptide (TPR) repeat protein
MLAIPNSPGIRSVAKVLSTGQIEGFCPFERYFRLAGIAVSLWACVNLFAADTNQIMASRVQSKADIAARADRIYREARSRFQAETNNAEAAWQFGRACFDVADSATNNAERAQIAGQGIAACRQLLARDSNSVAAHYYLGMNLGQFADAKRNASAFKFVKEMEREFQAARSLDEKFDYAGPDRNLGLLYREALIIISVGSRSKARQHLQRAVELAPDYPENRLNLVEACLKWGDHNGAQRELKTLADLWPGARRTFSGEAWAASWMDWEPRLKNAKTISGEASEAIETPRHDN